MTSREAIAKINVLSSYDTSEEKREAYKDCIYAILKDLEVLEILKKHITVSEKRIDTEFGNYMTYYDLHFNTFGLEIEQLNRIKECLDNDKQRSTQRTL